MQPLLITEKPVSVETKAESTDNADVEKYNLEMEIQNTQNSNKIRNFLSSIIDIKFFKKFTLSTACWGTSIAFSVDLIYSTLLPLAMFDVGCKQDEVASVLSLIAFGDLSTRVMMMFVSQWLLKLGSAETYLIGVALSIVSKLGVLWSETTMLRYLYTFLMGVARCFLNVINTMVIADAVPPEKFMEATGIFMAMFGILSFALGPAIGAVRDLTDSYKTTFYLLICLLAFTLIYWAIEIIYKKNKQKKESQQTNEKSDKSNKET